MLNIVKTEVLAVKFCTVHTTQKDHFDFLKNKFLEIIPRKNQFKCIFTENNDHSRFFLFSGTNQGSQYTECSYIIIYNLLQTEMNYMAKISSKWKKITYLSNYNKIFTNSLCSSAWASHNSMEMKSGSFVTFTTNYLNIQTNI